MQNLLRDEVLLAAFAVMACLEAVYKSPWLYLAAAIPMITFLIKTHWWLHSEKAKIDRHREELAKLIAELINQEGQDDRPD